MSEFSVLLDRIESDIPRSLPPMEISRPDAIRINAQHSLDELNPSDLARFLRDYLLDRAHASGDVEDLSDEASPLDVFQLDDRIVTVGEPEFAPDGPIAPDGLNDRPVPEPIGHNSDGTPRYEDDRMWY